jgi:hypothetical protein
MRTYFAFCDPSGGSSDSMTLAISRVSIITKKAILVGMWEKRAPFNPDSVVEEFAGILKDYHLTTVVGDRYSAEWVVERFRSYGITYTASEKTKSEIFLEFLALVNSDRIRIPRNRRLRMQLVSLERRTSRSGRDTVDHPPASHDDCANSVAGALCLAVRPKPRELFLPVVLDFRDASGEPFVDPHEGHDLSDPCDDFDERFWHRVN